MKRSEFLKLCGGGIGGLFLAQRGFMPGDDVPAEVVAEVEEAVAPTLTFATAASATTFPVEWRILDHGEIRQQQARLTNVT